MGTQFAASKHVRMTIGRQAQEGRAGATHWPVEGCGWPLGNSKRPPEPRAVGWAMALSRQGQEIILPEYWGLAEQTWRKRSGQRKQFLGQGEGWGGSWQVPGPRA